MNNTTKKRVAYGLIVTTVGTFAEVVPTIPSLVPMLAANDPPIHQPETHSEPFEQQHAAGRFALELSVTGTTSTGAPSKLFTGI